MHLNPPGLQSGGRLAGGPFSGRSPAAHQCHLRLNPSCGCRPQIAASSGALKTIWLSQRGLSLRLARTAPPVGHSVCRRQSQRRLPATRKRKPPRGGRTARHYQRVWRGLAPGSQKDLGCFSIPATPLPSLILCESAIDAISCFALHPHHRCLSTAGARPNPRWLQPLLDQGCQVYCGFDADPTGDDMACAMIALHPTVKRLRPSSTRLERRAQGARVTLPVAHLSRSVRPHAERSTTWKEKSSPASLKDWISLSEQVCSI